MNSYILKNKKISENILLYQEQNSYSFNPKKFKKVKKITILDDDILSSIWQNKVIKEYNRLLEIIYSLISSDDTTSGDVLVAYTEIERIKEYLLSLVEKGLKKEFAQKYINKLYVLELELKKVHVMELQEEISEEKGRGR